MSDLFDQALGSPAVAAIGTAIGLALVALWLAAAWWAYADARRRTDRAAAGFVAAGWVLVSTPLMLPLSLGIYALVRPQLAAGDQRVRSLIRAFEGVAAVDRHCAHCGGRTEPEWQRCPACATWLASPCSSCGRWSDEALEICPWCGEESRAAPYVEDLIAVTIPVMATAVTIEAGDTLAAPAAAEGRLRLPWRSSSPSVQRARRTADRRLALAPDGRRVNRTRIRA